MKDRFETFLDGKPIKILSSDKLEVECENLVSLRTTEKDKGGMIEYPYIDVEVKNELVEKLRFIHR